MRFSLVLAALGAVCVSGEAFAQTSQPAPSFWFDSWSSRGANDRAVDLAQARDQLQARTGGFGPGLSTTNYNGTVNSSVTYNGDVTTTSSGSTNIGQSNSTSANLSGTNGSNLILTVNTGQTMDDNSQRAGSQVNQTGGSAAIGGINQDPPR